MCRRLRLRNEVHDVPDELVLRGVLYGSSAPFTVRSFHLVQEERTKSSHMSSVRSSAIALTYTRNLFRNLLESGLVCVLNFLHFPEVLVFYRTGTVREVPD